MIGSAAGVADWVVAVGRELASGLSIGARTGTVVVTPMAGRTIGWMVVTTVVVTSVVRDVTAFVTGVTAFVTDEIVCCAEEIVSDNAGKPGTSGTLGNRTE